LIFRRRSSGVIAKPNALCCVPSMAALGLGCAKTKSDLVVMPTTAAL
jgi:hypothetical protein